MIFQGDLEFLCFTYIKINNTQTTTKTMDISNEAAFKQMRTMTIPNLQPPQPPRHVKRQQTQPPNVVLSSSTARAGNKKPDVLTVSMKPERRASTSAKHTKAVAAPLPVNTKTIQVVDMKETRHAIVANWSAPGYHIC